MNEIVNKGLERAETQSKLMAASLIDQKDMLPRTINREGDLETAPSKWWTSGFFPGVVWYMYEASGNE